MENKINIAELLKDCPKGMELDCSVFEDVALYKIDTDIENEFPIRIKTKNDYFLDLTKYGTYSNVEEAKCVIFPKGKTTWKGFHRPFIDGDIVATNDGSFIAIIKKNGGKYYCCCHKNGNYFITDYSGWFDRFATEEEKEKLFQAIKNNGYRWNSETKTLEELPKFKDGDVVVAEDSESQLFLLKEYLSKDSSSHNGHCYFGWDFQNNTLFEKGNWRFDRLATEEEKQKLFDAIKVNGYKWNEETKTLEKLVESKEDTDDRVVVAGIYFNREDYADEVELHLNNYEIEIHDGKTYAIFKNQETKISKPKFKVGDVIVDIYKKHLHCDSRSGKISQITDDKYIFTDGSYIHIQNQDNWELSPNKFDITTLKPFDKVLVRDFDDETWEINFFSRLLDNKHFKCLDLSYVQCIPYEGNEYLRGTTWLCKDYFKTWKDE